MTLQKVKDAKVVDNELPTGDETMTPHTSILLQRGTAIVSGNLWRKQV